jgi:hypothetical protein
MDALTAVRNRSGTSSSISRSLIGKVVSRGQVPEAMYAAMASCV